MAEQHNRGFKGVWIPANIWTSRELTLQEKAFLVEIDSLDNENGCYASNDYFAEFFQLSKSRCSEVISKLREKELLSINLIYKEGTKQVEKRIIRVNRMHHVFTGRGIRNPEEGVRETERGIRDIESPPSEKAKENNTVINNTTNNTENKRKEPLPHSPLVDMNFLKIKQHYEQQVIYQPANFQQCKHLAEILDNHQDTALIIEAMNISVQSGKPHLPYINGILNTWRSDNITNQQQLRGVKKRGATKQPIRDDQATQSAIRATNERRARLAGF